ncbi:MULTISPECIES: VPLPA-CTERM sorting domain-containing protein [unclassified Pseudomonas]|uniref:VPLPA-CTERM sorting domain-containing protein n=1 Tax=Pseudomonas sp. MYb327 TaxID=2745230 RepID=A0AAU8E9M2_9PSED
MRPTLFFKFVLVSTLLNGAAVFSAQATSLTNEFNNMSNACADLAAETALDLEGPATGELSTFESSLGVPSLISNSALLAQFSSVIYHSDSGKGSTVNSSACDGLMAAASIEQLKDAQAIDPTASADSLANASNAVPLPAAAWLFSSALLGFIVVANRRKV